ncbi:MAG: hypothetical protein BGP01_05800 [Paludibacter sp. 47-17]|nr:MAG: hypothetical protein BGP01_05800 [Paludibacter sp. 47-17]
MEDSKKTYLDTEFGKIPSDWVYCTFKDVLNTFSSGATPYRAIPEYYKGKIRWISSGELNYNVIYDTIEHISETAVKNTNLKMHESGTFLMAITGLEAEGTRGRCAIVGAPSTTNQSCLALNGTKKLGTDYLFWFYRQWGDYLAFKYCQGTKQQSYTAAIVKKLPICCPKNTKEQTAIATALSDTDALIAALDKKIAKKQQIKQGTMQQLLTGKKRLPGFSGEWVEKKLGEVGKISMGQSPLSQFYNCERRGLPLIQGNADIEKRQTIIRVYTSQVTKMCDIGDIILSVRAPVGAVAKSTLAACIGRGVCAIKSENDYLFHYLVSIENDWGKYSKGSTFDSISSNELYEVVLSIPVSEIEQNAIAQILTDMDNEIARLQKDRDKYKEIKAGMMQVLLTGRMRLV